MVIIHRGSRGIKTAVARSATVCDGEDAQTFAAWLAIHSPEMAAETIVNRGCEAEAVYPLGPLFNGGGRNVTVMSLNGKLNVGVISCPDLMPDLWRLVDDFHVAVEELLERRFRRAGEVFVAENGRTRAG